jgi:hypothetical protein
MTFARPVGNGGFAGMFAERPAGSGCRCVPDITGTAELHGDELVIDGKERLYRKR